MTGLLDVDLVLPYSPQAAGDARAALGVLSGRVRPELLENLRLLVSELVTNAVRHSGLGTGWVRLEVRLSNDRIRVRVTDPGDCFEPGRAAPSIYQTSGWGLFLVEQISDRWGVRCGEETEVWFELDHRRSKKPVGN